MENQTFILAVLSGTICFWASILMIIDILSKSERNERIVSLVIALISGYFVYYFKNILDILCK